MSSILKALKKLEEEQAGRPAFPATGSGGQLVTSIRGGRPLLLLIGGIGVGLLLAGGLFLWLGGVGDVQKSLAPTAAEQKAATVTYTPAPSACQVVGAPPKSAPLPPASSGAGRPVKVTAATESPAATKIVAAAATPAVVPAAAPSGTVAEPRPEPVEQVRIERREIPAPGQQWSAPQLTVNDILPASGGGRMAIVNGLPVMEGTAVEDAVVKEIRSDQVIFEVDGKSVVVPLAASR
ncbi:MAG: hypothetical protein FIB02_03005 [Desulfuromonas sp.]|nr:hypothetical protein [Desulfuromonas sp.]